MLFNRVFAQGSLCSFSRSAFLRLFRSIMGILPSGYIKYNTRKHQIDCERTVPVYWYLVKSKAPIRKIHIPPALTLAKACVSCLSNSKNGRAPVDSMGSQPLYMLQFPETEYRCFSASGRDEPSGMLQTQQCSVSDHERCITDRVL